MINLDSLFVRKQSMFLVLALNLTLTGCVGVFDKSDSALVPTVESILSERDPIQTEANNDVIGSLAENHRIEKQHEKKMAPWTSLLNSSTLNALLEEADQYNLDLQALFSRWEAAQATNRAALGRRLPSLSAGLQRDRSAVAENDVNNSVVGNFTASWELDLWGRLALGHKSAFNNALQQSELLRWAQLSLASMLTQNWLDRIEAGQQLLLAEQREKNLQDNLDIIENGFRAGIREALDVYSARAEFAGSQSSTLERRQRTKDLGRQLAALLGRFTSAGITVPAVTPAVANVLPEQLSLNLLERRPDVVASARALVAQQANLGIARANRLPSFNIRGSYGASNDTLHRVLDGDDLLWNTVLGLTAPLFQGGQIKAEQQRQQALLDASMADYKKSVLAALFEVEQALDYESVISEQLAATRRANDISQLAERRAFESYVAGLSNLNTWLQAQRTAFDRSSQLLRLENDLLKNRIALYLALGGDFDLETKTVGSQS